MLTKLLANRLQKVISEVVNFDQSGYIKGRYIGENIRSIYDVIQYTSLNSMPGMIVALDFEKAFDSVSWQFLFETLKRFNFGPNFIKWIEIIYSEPECCVINNGHYSEFFKLSRGIRQGCPISALLFLLVVEVMAINLRNDKNIKGISLTDTEEILISQLADDTTLFLRDSESLERALTFIKAFGESSGLKLNKEKTEAFWIGSKVLCKEKPLNLKWTRDFIKCLGIWCGPDIEGAITKTFTEKLKKLKNLLNMWSCRKLSLKGKVAVLRSLALPQILYPSSILFVPEWVIHDVEELFFNFLWSNKKHHVKKEVITNEIHNGGLKVPLFGAMVKAIKCTWVQRILKRDKSRNSLLNQLISYRNLDIQDIVTNKLDTRYIQIKSPFYLQMLQHWYTLFSRQPGNLIGIFSASLWNNCHICIDGKPVYYKSWSEKGIKLYGNIIGKNGNLLTKEEMENRYSFKIKQMDYNSLIHAIPSEWKIKSKGTQPVIQTQLCDKIYINKVARNISTLCCKDLYWEFVSMTSMSPKSEQKWSKYLNAESFIWQDIYVIPYNVTRETVIQSFQYKILHRFYPCNYTLSVWYKDQSPHCNQCNEVDLPEHFFFHCKHVQHLWLAIENWWRNILEVTFKLDVNTVIFGIPRTTEDTIIDIMNYCILYAKYFIHQKKVANEDIFFLEYIKLIKNKLEVEKMTCTLKQDPTFEKKWAVFYDLL